MAGAPAARDEPVGEGADGSSRVSLSPESTGAPDNAVENRGTGTAEHVDSEPPYARLMAAAQLLQSRTEVATGMAFLTTTLVAGAPTLGEGGDADGAPTVIGYVDSGLSSRAMATPGGEFLTTTLGVGAPTPGEGGDADGAPTVIPPPYSEGPPHLRHGPPQPKRTTAEHGFPKDPVRFGKPDGGGVDCTPSRCYCTVCNPKDPHNPKDRLWCFADCVGNLIWCQKDTYTRENGRFQAVELRWGRGGRASGSTV